MSVNRRCPSKSCCVDDDMRVKNKSHLTNFSHADLIDWRINGISPSYNFSCGSVVLASGMTLLVFAKEFQPWLMTDFCSNSKTKKYTMDTMEQIITLSRNSLEFENCKTWILWKLTLWKCDFRSKTSFWKCEVWVILSQNSAKIQFQSCFYKILQ